MKKKNDLSIKKANQGKLTEMARREGGLKKDGGIKMSWMKKKMANNLTRPETKEMLNYAINSRGWDKK